MIFKWFFNIITILVFVSNVFAQQNPIVFPGIEDTNRIAYGHNGGPVTSSNDAFGVSVSNIGDLDNDGVDDLVVGAQNDDNGGSSSLNYGAVYVCFMNANKTVKSSTKIGKGTSGIGSDISSLDYFGRSVAGIGDFNNDGKEDIAVGAYGSDVTSYTNSGAIYIIFLNSSGGVASYKKIKRGTNGGPTSMVANSWFGKSVTSLGDLNGDRIPDIGVGGDGHDGPLSGTANGAYWSLIMNSDGTVNSSTIITKSTGWSATIDNSDALGISVAGTGDLNGDGIGDVIVGANGDDDYAANDGCFYLLYLTSSGGVSSYKKYTQPLINKVNYYTNTSAFGFSLAANDINDDGQPEFFVGTPFGKFFIIATDSSENVISAITYADNLHSSFSFSGFGFGISLTTLNDIDGDGKKELVSGGNIFDSNSLTNNGGIIVLDMETTDLEVSIGDVLDIDKYGDLSNSIVTLDASDLFGASVCDIGDVNGDGINDIAIGSFGDDDGGTNRGAVYVVFLDSLQHKTSVQKISSTSGSFGSGLDDSDGFGVSVCAPGDLDADGIPDLVVGANQDDDGGTDRGCIYVLYLNSTGTVKSKIKISDLRGGFGGTLINSDKLGTSVAATGDINHDGINDLVVGASLDDDGGADRGAVWVMFMNSADSVSSYQKISDTQGSFSETFSGNSVGFGISVCDAGDLNEDGKNDIVVGSSSMNGLGAAYILYLDTLGKVSSYKKISSANSNFPVTIQTGKQFGRAVQMISDLNGDGNKEIVISQNLYTSYGTDKGATWICFPDKLGNILDAKRIGEGSGLFYGNLHTDCKFGTCLSKYTDKYSNEFVFVGAQSFNENSTDEGAVYKLSLVSISTILSSTALQKYMFYDLNKSLDGGVYLPINFNYLRFKYFEEYGTTATPYRLRYNIYTSNQTFVSSNLTHPGSIFNHLSSGLDKNFGQNYLRLNIGSSGHCLPPGYYILEVINDKEQKEYLRFYKKNVSLCTH